MRILETLWLRLTFRRRPRLSPRVAFWRRSHGDLSARDAAWAQAIGALFDTRYYLHTHPHVRHQSLSAPAHYVSEGHRLGYHPAPWFSDAGYLADYPDVAEAGLPAFVHYVLYGRNEGRHVTPTDDISPTYLARTGQTAAPAATPHRPAGAAPSDPV